MYFYKSKHYRFKSEPDGIPNSGEMFVEHSKAGRGGHLGHGMVEYEPGKILCFYSNCNDDNGFTKEECDFTGHSGRGWTEYKRSIDGGKTWSEGEPLAYSKNLYDSGVGLASFCEKVVLCDDGTIVVFNLVSDVREDPMWEPYFYPSVMRSADGGETWTDPDIICERNARVYDVIRHDNRIYVLLLEHKGEKFYAYPAQHYYIYASDDNGQNFYMVSELPFECAKDTIYGTMEILDDGGMIVYTYTPDKEEYLRYIISYDCGKNWSDIRLARFAKKIRNPQMIKFKDTFFMFGRSGIYGADEEKGHNVLYCSGDGINWDLGRYICFDEVGFTTAFYSNVIKVGTGDNERLLYQYSKAYRRSLTNIMHRWIDAEVIEDV